MRVLLAEDDEKLNESLTYQLKREGFSVDSCFNGDDALYYAQQNIYDVILLDRMLPLMEGTSVLDLLRKENNPVPVILITALGTLSDKVTGLNMGADDYLVKPFAFEELLARIRCVTRRPPILSDQDNLTVSDVIYHTDEHRISGPKGSCSLSKREAALMEIFMQNHSQTLSRELLLLKVWGPDSDVENGNLDNYIHFLRRRLTSVNSTLQIKTVRSIGYCLKDTNN